MEKLTMCAKILYDKDVIEKNRENKELKKKLEWRYAKIIFPNEDAYEEAKKNMMENIKTCIDECIPNEHNFMTNLSGGRYAELAPRHRMNIWLPIEGELKKLTNNSSYSYGKGAHITDDVINPALFSLYKIGIFEDLLEEDVVDLVYNIVKYHLIGNPYEGCGGLIGSISYYNCKNCGKETETDGGELCFDCDDDCYDDKSE